MVEHNENVLYVRFGEHSDLPTPCLSSLTSFCYLKCADIEFRVSCAVDMAMPYFQFGDERVDFINDAHEISLVIYSDLENTLFKLRKLKDLDHFVTNDLLRKKASIMESLMNIRRAALLEFYVKHEHSFLGAQQEFTHLKGILGITNDTQTVQLYLHQQAIDAFRRLSEQLCWDRCFLRQSVDGVSCVSNVDAVFISTGMFILGALGDSSQLSTQLHKYPNLCTLIDRFRAVKMPRRVARIRYVRELGEGRTSVVNQYDGSGILGDGSYAVKEFKKKITGLFMNERILLEAFQYPNVMEILAYGDRENREFIVCKRYVCNLKERLEHPNGNELDWLKSLKILKQIAYTVHLIHSHYRETRFILCDLSAMNVLLDGNDNAIICDLGSATEDGCISEVYTPPYSDTGRGNGIARPYNDIYSIGSLIIKILTAENPGDEQSLRKNLEDGIQRVIRKNLLDTGCNPAIAAEFIDIAIKCHYQIRENRPELTQVLDVLWKY